MNNDNVNPDQFVRHLTWEDYLVFSFMLVISAGIGVFYGCFGNKMNNTKDFLLAGKSMGVIPVAISLAVSFLSSITLLGGPSEVYVNGLEFWLSVAGNILCVPFVLYIFIPVHLEVQLTSVYEYLEVRFNKYLRFLGSGIFMLQMTLYMVFAVYAPALALSQMTELTLYTSVFVMVFVCIFYTSLGGMKAVIWTDVVQALTMYACLLFVYIRGISDTGGFGNIWEINKEGGRTRLVNWDPNPTIRLTFWSLTIAPIFTWTNVFACNQTQVQRYFCIEKKKSIGKALLLSALIIASYTIISCFGGLLIYARYGDCDPVKSGRIKKNDQLFPLFAMDILRDYPGVPGLLIAGIFSGSLSTVSSGLNSLAAITLEDYIKKIRPSLTDYNATIISKLLSAGYGLLTLGLIFIVEKFGNILEASYSVFGMLSGPNLGLFTLGMLVPWANNTGAIIGFMAGLAASLWIGLGYRIAVATGRISAGGLPTTTTGCDLNTTLISDLEIITNVTEAPLKNLEYSSDNEDILGIYKLSYLWYAFWGFSITFIIGLLVSLVTGPRKDVDRKLLCPLIHRFLPKETDSQLSNFSLKNNKEMNNDSTKL